VPPVEDLASKAELALFAVLWLAMPMKISTVGIAYEAALLSGLVELAHHGLRPLGEFVGALYVLVGLHMRLRATRYQSAFPYFW
jgi:hypothetical protein